MLTLFNCNLIQMLTKKYIATILLFLISLVTYAQKTYNVGVLTDEYNAETEGLLNQLKDEIRAVVGEDAVMTFSKNNTLNNSFDFEKAKTNYNTLINNETDIILAFGSINNIVISQKEKHLKPTIVFGPLNSEIKQIDTTQQGSGIKNLTYLIIPQSFQDDLTSLKALYDFKSLGVIVEKPILDNLPLKEIFDREVGKLGASYRFISFDNVDDITNNLQDIDAVYLASGFFLDDTEIKTLATKFVELGLPSFTVTSRRDVQNGLMATNQVETNITQFFRRIALTIEAYVTGTPLEELPMYIESDESLTININTTTKLNIPFKYSMISKTDFVGELRNANAEKVYNLLDVFNETLDKNLSLQSNKKNIELNQQDVKIAKSNYLPNVSNNTSLNYVDPNAASILNPEYSVTGALVAEQVIFSQPANANITIQENVLKAQQESFNSAELDAILNASNLYFSILASKVNLQIQIQNLQLTKENLRIASQNFESGQTGKVDVLRFESQLAQNTQAFVEAINQLTQDFIALNQTLNNPTELEIDIDDAQLGKGVFERYNYQELAEILDNSAQIDPFIAFLIEEAKANSPDLKSLAYNIKATERSVQLYGKDRFLPTVALQARVNYTLLQEGKGSTIDPNLGDVLAIQRPPFGNYNVGLNVSIPIVSQNRNNIQKQTAMIQKDQLDIEQKNLELAIATNVSQAVLSLINQISNIELSRVSEQYALESLELAQSSYSNGAVNIIQLIDAQNNYFQAQLARATAEYSYILTALQIERLISYNFLLHTPEENQEFRERFGEFLKNYNND